MVKRQIWCCTWSRLFTNDGLIRYLEIALKKTKFTGDLAADRNKLRDAIADTTDFSGLASGPN